MSDLLSYYRWSAPFYDLTRWAVLPGRSRAVRSLGLQPGETVLEIGTGTGRNLPELSRRVGSAGRVVGLDLSPDMLHRARRRVRRERLDNVLLIRADAGRFGLTLPVDAVLMSYSLSMMSDTERVVSLAADALGPGGRLVAVDFGPFRHWGPLRPLLRAWLRLNHVAVWTDRDDPDRAPGWFRTPFDGIEGRALAGSYATLLIASLEADA